MRRFAGAFGLSLVLSFFVLWAGSPSGFFEVSQAVTFPKATGFVNDFANVLSAEERVSLEATLAAFEKETSNEIVVAIVPSFEGLDRFTYAQELFTAWGVGKEGRNNGVLFVMGPKEGAPFPAGGGEVFVNVGKGLEGALPDSVTGSILRSEAFPQFKEKQYFEGIRRGVAAIIQATKGEYTPMPESKGRGLSSDAISFIFLGAYFFIVYLASFLGRTKSWWLGGVIGAAGAGVVGIIFWSAVAAGILAAVFGVIGSIFDFTVSKNYQYRKSHGRPTDFWHSGGGFWRGGGGGFSGGGGFGGFGGGSSGGGGAGGSW